MVARIKWNVVLVLVLAFGLAGPKSQGKSCDEKWRSVRSFSGHETAEKVDQALLGRLPGYSAPATRHAVQAWLKALTPSEANRLLSLVNHTSYRPQGLEYPDGATRLQQTFRIALAHAEQASLDAAGAYTDVLYSTPGVRTGLSAAAMDAAFVRYQEGINPYKTANGLGFGGNPGEKEKALKDILRFEGLVRSGNSKHDLAKDALHWVKSPAHALYLYQHANELGDARNAVLHYLLGESQYFKDALPIRGPPGTFMTFAFEKETRNLGATLMYKDPSYSDADWIALPETSRKSILQNLLGHKEKSFQPAERIAPTSLKPEALGGYSQEFSHSGTGWLMEFAHQGYDFNRKRIFAEMTEVSLALKERDFHLHMVFDLPKKYDRMMEFSTWTKQVNDYLYLTGVEEGIHPDRLTQLPKPAKKPHFLTGLFKLFTSFAGFSDTLPARLQDVDYQTYKFFGASVRATHYGESTDPRFQKVGLELRDVTRKMPMWEKLLTDLPPSIQKRIWENRKYGAKRNPKELILRQGNSRDVPLLVSLGIDKALAKELLKVEPNLIMPLLKFEEHEFYDYQTGTYRSIPEPEHARVREARDAYATSLLQTQKELLGYKARKEAYESQDVATAVRWSIADWAKKAQVSSYFSGL